ncbi:hypothetical protein [Actinoplanes hulinensis]|uniref:hypothetical protein n=1 Tax=Actinoplanes hulinensis TaxID=1144547 RepID=UPI003557BB7C
MTQQGAAGPASLLVRMYGEEGQVVVWLAVRVVVVHGLVEGGEPRLELEIPSGGSVVIGW